MSNIVHKVKEAVSGHHDKHSQSTNAGPHDSNIANKADPRVDSDRDHRAAHSAAGTTGGAYDTTTTGYTGTTGTTGTTGVGYDNPRSTNAGPHDSNLANKIDPRVDSDRSQYGTGMNTGTTTGTTTGGLSSGGVYDNSRSTNAGPHDSNLANKMDPRVDSDRSQYGTGVTTGTTTGTTTGGMTSGGTYDNPRSTNVGPHSSNMANKVDPRVDSDMDNRARHQEMGSYGGATAGNSYNTPGSGNVQKTAGPHDSDLANKLDPRVDSDLDGSRTVGGNATHY